jgi:hypothetical protein
MQAIASHRSKARETAKDANGMSAQPVTGPAALSLQQGFGLFAVSLSVD